AERIVMTPKKSAEGHTTIKMERVAVEELDEGSVMHFAGGDHQGIVINRLTSHALFAALSQFVFAISMAAFHYCDKNALEYNKESRELKFWFKPHVAENDRRHAAQDFFKDLVSPGDFPRDYVGFIKKIMKLMQVKYPNMRKVEIDMKQLENISEPPTRPSECAYYVQVFGGTNLHSRGADKCAVENDGAMSMDDSMVGSKTELSQEKVLEVIESAYPNPVSLGQLAKSTLSAEEEVHLHLRELLAKNLIKEMDSGSYTRVVQNDTEVKLVRQMPTVHGSQQPTIAIITAQYCEKLAVDVMIENKNTFVRYKTEGEPRRTLPQAARRSAVHSLIAGESNVYTLGNIGAHRVVSTKLPAVGHSRGAIIAAGNTTTRLLGTFQKVDYVFLVGVGGGVPHYTDHSRHVRLGDVVVSAPTPCGAAATNGSTTGAAKGRHVYLFAEPQRRLQEVAEQLWQQGALDPSLRPWEDYIREGAAALADQESDFSRPPASSDHLYMSIGGKDLIEVGHPTAPRDTPDPRLPGRPVVHLGPVGSGRGSAVREDAQRHALAEEHGVRAFDTGFDSVVESVFGNRKDNYAFVRGIADYKDGSKGREWQPYAALAAAAFMKAVVCALAPLDEE
ncbi:conserved hypothetical protein, partial [Ixodes scapularis]